MFILYTQKSKVKQRLYVLGMQIIFIAFHLKLFVLFDKDYLYLTNWLVCFSLAFILVAGMGRVSWISWLFGCCTCGFLEFSSMWTATSACNYHLWATTACGKNCEDRWVHKKLYCAESNTRRHSKLISPKLQYYKIFKVHYDSTHINLTATIHIRSGGTVQGGEPLLLQGTNQKRSVRHLKVHLYTF